MTAFGGGIVRHAVRCTALAVAVTLAPTVCLAQNQPGSTDATPSPQRSTATDTKRADLRLTVNGAYDWADFDDTALAPFGDGQTEESAASAAGSANLTFTSTSRNVNFSAIGATNQRHFANAPSFLRSDYFGRVTVGARLATRVSAFASQRISYSPYYSLVSVLQGGDLTPEDVLQPDFGVVRSDTFTAGGTAGLTWVLGPRTGLTTGYSIDLVDTLGTRYGVLSQGASARLSRRLTPHATLNLGYAFRQTRLTAGAQPYMFHDLGLGFGYTRPISSSRRTYVSFDTGAALITYARRSFVFTGGATLTHQISRTWGTALSYHRGVSTYAGLAQPYIADTVYGSVGGELSRRVSVAASGGYTHGSAAVEVDNGFGTFFGRGRIHFDMLRYVPLFAEYVVYQSRFERPIGVAAGFPLYVRRQGVRAGLAYSMPLDRSRR